MVSEKLCVGPIGRSLDHLPTTLPRLPLFKYPRDPTGPAMRHSWTLGNLLVILTAAFSDNLPQTSAGQVLPVKCALQGVAIFAAALKAPNPLSAKGCLWRQQG
jgi:hypothetical protein